MASRYAAVPQLPTEPTAAATRDAADLDLAALREENEQLRDLVIQLSRIVARNVMDRR